jgi:hypothetical protein
MNWFSYKYKEPIKGKKALIKIKEELAIATTFPENYRNVCFKLKINTICSKKEKIVRVFLGRKGFLRWQLNACSLCICILRLLRGALSFLLVLYLLPFCRGAFHDLDGVGF